MAYVISFMSAKGGVAKTSSTIEIAAIFKKKGFRTLVIDLDENCSLSKNVGAEWSSAERTIYEVLHATENVYDCIQHLDIFDIIVGSKSLSRVPKEFVEDDDNFLLADLMEILKEDYDFIFIDNAPSRSKLLTMTYIAVDYVIAPTVCDESSTDMIIEVENDIYKLVNNRHHDSHAKIIGYVLTCYKSNTSMHSVALEKMQDLANEKEGDLKPFIMTVTEGIIMSEVKTFHTAVCLEKTDKKTEKIQNEYKAISDAILKRVGK